MTRRLLPAAAALVLLGLAAQPAAAQCAMCATTVANSEEGRALAGSLNSAILLMLAAPYAVFGTFAAVFFRRRIRHHLSELAARALPGRLRDRRTAPPPAVG